MFKEIETLSNNKVHSKGYIKFITKRDDDYKKSWKVKRDYSGGILFNLGIHYFDLIIKNFGKPHKIEVNDLNDFRSKGKMLFQDLDLDWIFSINDEDLPIGEKTIREFSIDGKSIDFSQVSNDLHELNYKEIVFNKKFKLSDLIETHMIVSDIYDI